MLKNLLLLSNSKVEGFDYLGYAENSIQEFLGNKVNHCVFLPFAAVTFSFDDYLNIVAERFAKFGCHVSSVHNAESPVKAVKEAEALVVGGGNTYQLLEEIYENELIEPIRENVLNGTPYIGWSAGSNLACPSIKTTNDMPIVFPPSFDALNLIPFQINPHYTEAMPPGHKGETRSDRINEFLVRNENMKVVGLPEGCLLKIENGHLKLVGEKVIKLFQSGQKVSEFKSGDNIDFLLN